VSAKLSKESVGFEHPAKGPHHCGQCRHFEGPRACEIVAGLIRSEDWCRRFEAKRRRFGDPPNVR
jgi:hypothetical protein